MNKNNKALFILVFAFYFIGDLVTTYIALSNGMPESGLIWIITRYDFSIMFFMKMIFFTFLYFLIEYLEKRDNYLCGAGNDDNMDECSGHLGHYLIQVHIG